MTTAMVLVVKPDFPAKDLAQFMDYARGHPNMTAGYGSGASQISIGAIAKPRRPVGHSGILSRGAAGRHRRAGRRNRSCLCGFSLAIPQMQGGTLRGIGVTSPKRNELTPGLPALAEAMPGFEATIWYGLLAPAGTPSRSSTSSIPKAKNSCRCPRPRKARRRRRDRLPDASGRIRRLHPQRNLPLDGGCEGRRDRSEIARQWSARE